MHFETLPTEILTQIYLSLPTIASAVALSATCHRLSNVYHSSQKLFILQQTADFEFGPIEDVVQLLTQNASQPAHIRRSVPMSEAFLQQVVRVGRAARKYEEIYPFKKWKTDFANRRSLSCGERYLLRRAIYRLWLFDRAFHNSNHVRTCRDVPGVVQERAALLHNYSTAELAEMLDVHAVLRDMVANNICPSNGKMRQRFQKRFPDNPHQPLFNIHLNYPPSPSTFVPDGWHYNSAFSSAKYPSRLAPSRWHEPGAEGWGDDITHYYVVEDMMKLDPEQLLFLRDNCPLKVQVEMHVRALGDWFGNNGETFSETLAFVVRQRGGDADEVKALVQEGELGVAVAS